MAETYKNRKKAHLWLQKQGFKLSERKFYKDVELGLCVMQADGSITSDALARYMLLADLKRPAAETAAAAATADAKQAEEIKQLQLKNERLEHEIGVMRGKYIEKIEADAYAADLAALLDAVPRHIIQLNGPRYLAAIGADPAKARQFFDLFDLDFTNAVNRICEDGGATVEGGQDADLATT
jgi:hypothetical protein